MNTAQTTQNIAQTIAKQMAQEPIEILKDAKESVTGQKASNPGSSNLNTSPEENIPNLKANDTAKSARLIEAFQRELDDIRKQDMFNDLQRKIAEGEIIPLENYQELSMEQKQVLKAQMEAVQVQIANSKNSGDTVIQEPVSKKGRQLFNFGKKTAMKREQTRVEKINPPSG